MRRILSILLSLSMVLMLFASIAPVGAEEEHSLHKYINYVTEESILPGVENPDDAIPADTFAAGLSLVLGKDLEYTGEDFTRAEMFKFAIDNNDAIKNDISEYDFPAWCLALDEETIPEEYVPYFNMAARPLYNLLTYRYRETAWAEAPSYAEAAFLLYRTQFPPNTDPEQVLTCVTQQEPDTLNPFGNSTTSMSYLRRFTTADSVEFGDDAILFPNILKRVPSLENGDVVVFTDEITGKEKMKVVYRLRSSLYWPALPGEPEGSKIHEITADDVLYGVREGMCPILQAITRSGDWKIDKVIKIDKYTVEIQFNEMYAYAAWGLPGLSYKAMYETELITDPDNHNVRQDFIDTYFGPYRIKEWNEGNFIDFEPNPYSVFAQPLIPNIRVKFMSDANTIKLNLKAGEIDVVYNAFSPLDAKEIEDDLNGTYKFHYVESTGWEHIDLNQFADDPENEDDLGLEYLFGDKHVRQALLYALDREKLCKMVSKGIFTTSHLWLSRLSKYYKKAEEMDAFKKYEYNPAKAEQLLEDAGWKLEDGIRTKTIEDGKKTQLKFFLATASGQPFRTASVENIIKMWDAIGVRVTSDFKSSTVLFGGDYLRRHQFEAVEFAWTSNPIRPNCDLFSREQMPVEENGWSGQNMGGWYGDDEHEELVEAIQMEQPDDELQELFNREFAIWAEELPALPLYNRYSVDVTKYNLENYKPTGSIAPHNWNCVFWYLEQ